MFSRMSSFSSRLYSNHPDRCIIEKIIKESERIAPPSNARYEYIWYFSSLMYCLFSHLFSNNLLKKHIHTRVWVWSARSSQEIVTRITMIDEIFHSGVDSTSKRCLTVIYWHNSCTCEFHIVDIGPLSIIILSSHIDNTFESHPGTDTCCRKTMLSGSGFCYDTGFSEIFCKKYLSDTMIDFVSSCMIESFILEVELRSSILLCYIRTIHERGWSSHVVCIQSMEIFEEFRIIFHRKKSISYSINNWNK